ncbi:MAG: hypothetical protein MI921_02430 [Cytophagales bacterium]|nr:hypothetical protein [Cytophagales bacterium]
MKNFNKANIYWEWGLFPVALLLDLDKKEKAMQMAITLMSRAGLASNYHPDKQVALSSMPVRENLFIMNYLARTFRSKRLEAPAARFEKGFMKYLARIEGM